MRILKISILVFLSVISVAAFAQKKTSKKSNNTEVSNNNTKKDGHNITVTLKGFNNTMFYLGYYFGDKQYLRDSAFTDKNGKMTFSGDSKLEGGVYLIASADKSLLFDFIVTEQNFSLETDTLGYIEYMKVSGSAENEAFFTYSKFTTSIGKKAVDIESKIKQAKESNNKEKEDALVSEYRELMKQLNDERKRILETQPNLLISKIFKMMQDVDVPDAPKNAKGEIIDSNFQYQYYKTHYFDNFDFSDDRITRTPIFFPKFETFILKITPQIPDSIIKSADQMLNLASKGKENFKFCLFWTTNYYEASQYMGMDAVFVHLIDNYYAKGKAYWVDSLLIWRMKDKCDKLRHNLIGKKAKNLNMLDTNGRYHSLYNMDSKYTLLIFWNATCGHCKEEMPKIVNTYKELNKGLAPKSPLKFDVYSVSLTENIDDWKKYLIEQKLPWKLNVYDPLNETNFRQYYDVYTTPVLYILDKNKKIIAKRIAADQITEFINNAEKFEKELKK
ncbi:MAG: thioredoxin-like domain-containing protein [Candidatus Methylacidiphilales bacterium]